MTNSIKKKCNLEIGIGVPGLMFERDVQATHLPPAGPPLEGALHGVHVDAQRSPQLEPFRWRCHLGEPGQLGGEMGL